MKQQKRISVDELEKLGSDQEYSDVLFDEQTLNGKDLKEIVFKNCSFIKTNFMGTKLNGAVFIGCNFSNSNVTGCNFFGTQWIESKLTGVNFSRANSMVGSSFKKCVLDYADLRALDLSGQNLEGCSFIEADLSLCNLTHTSFMNCHCEGMKFDGAICSSTDFRGATLQGITLGQTNLKGIILTDTQVISLAEELGIIILS